MEADGSLVMADGVVLDLGPALDDRPLLRALMRRVQRLSAAAVHVVLTAPGDVAEPALRLARRSALRSRGCGVIVDRADALAGLGVAPGLVLHLVAGPAAPAVLDAQLSLRARHRVPAADDDPAWTLVPPNGDPHRVRSVEALLTLGDGTIGTRGALEEGGAGARPLVLAAGVYAGHGPGERLLPGPLWAGLDLAGSHHTQRRILDLRRGVLMREELAGAQPLRTLRFASAARPGVVALRAEGPFPRLRAGPALQPPADPHARSTTGRIDGCRWARVTSEERGGIAGAAVQRVGRQGGLRTVERIAAYQSHPRHAPRPGAAVEAVMDAAALGFDALLDEHRRVWARRWTDVDVEIPTDQPAQLALRFALFQLWGNVGGHGEHATGARGVSGPGYCGHVFWDADVYALPAMGTLSPPAARAMLEYRIRRLAGARALAAARGLAGVRFPWESARDGDDVTPRSVRTGGEVVPVLTGDLEEHVTADVAWAADHYATWCADPAFLTGPGRELVTGTAAYWASRIRPDGDGRGHIDRVTGPDEYHIAVDDDMFTNAMAAWNLRRAAALTPGPQGRDWRELADGLVTGFDPITGRHEQFAGYDGLESLLAGDVADPPFAADLLLGRERTAGSQLIKQPDVLMAHYLVPGHLPAGSLPADLGHYAPRTTHGSSLSPPVMAAVLARAGRADEALHLLRVALSIDLDDLTGTGAAGLHLAALGGSWWAVVSGFAGLHVTDGVLRADPHLPAAWEELRLRLHCRRRRIHVRIAADRVRMEADGRLAAAVGHGPATAVRTPVTWRLTGSRWVVDDG